MIATADTAQLTALWEALANISGSHLPIDTLAIERTVSHNYSLTVRVPNLAAVQMWAAALDQPVHLAGSDGICVGGLADMRVVVTSRGAM